MQVAVVGIGTELVLGDLVDTNAAWIMRACTRAGLVGAGSATVIDDVAAIADAVGAALSRADAVVLTGGLGPTTDDVTREALARLAGSPLRRDDDLEQALRARFAATGRDLPDVALRQADRVVGARALPNALGTAPGIALTLPAGEVYAVPGVPREMCAMVTAEVLPALLARAGDVVALHTRTLRTAGVGESEVARCLDGLEVGAGVDLAFLASLGEVRVRLSTRAPDRAGARQPARPLRPGRPRHPARRPGRGTHHLRGAAPPGERRPRRHLPAHSRR